MSVADKLPRASASTRALNPELFPPEIVTTPAFTAPARTNRANDGRSFQKEVEMIAGAYQTRRVAVLRKVDPPVSVIWPFDKATGKKIQRVIFKQNPWLDFCGSWEAKGGRMLLVEAKSTSSHRLPFNRHGGLTMEQVATIKTWHLAGAAVCVLWLFNGRVTLWTAPMLVAAEGRGDKSLVFESGLQVAAGPGSLIWDFLPVLERELNGTG